MAIGKRNRSKYAGESDRRFVGLVDYNDDELEAAWRRANARDPLIGFYDRLKAKNLASLSCEDVLKALEFLHEATGVECFRGAVVEMERHGLASGGLKSAALHAVEGRTAAHLAALRMHVWIVREGLSVDRAAKLTAAERGLPALSFDAAVKSLKKAYDALPEEAKKLEKVSEENSKRN
jgi:hypothetical protein